MEQVYQYIDENKEIYVQWLQEFCRQPSISMENIGMKETAELVKMFLQDVGISVEMVETEGYPIVYGESSQDKPITMTFYNHYDVQPPEPLDEWECDPFSAVIRNGKLIARGAADNKGSLMARICALHAYQKVIGDLPINIKFVIEGEEECGSRHIKEFTEKHPDKVKTDLCIWENGIVNSDGSFEVKLGNKGMLYVQLIAKGANVDLHSSNGAIIKNPAWRLVWALNTLKNEQEEVLIDHFYDRVLPPSLAEKKILEQMELDEKEILERLELNEFLLGLTSTELKERFIFQPTCTICGITSGFTGKGAKTVLPSEATARVDFRLVPDQVPQEILALLRAHLDRHGFEDIEIVAREGTRPSKTDPENPYVKKVLSGAEKFRNIPPRVILMNPGTGPMHTLCQQFGIPTVGFGVGNPDSRKHAPNENILIQDYIDGIKMVTTVIHEFAQKKQGRE